MRQDDLHDKTKFHKVTAEYLYYKGFVQGMQKAKGKTEKEIETFERGTGDWEKLCNFMDEHNFSCADFLAVICAHLCSRPQKDFETELFVAGHEFKIRIEKK